MNNNITKNLVLSLVFISLFIIFTFMVIVFDVQPLGESGTVVGFSHINGTFHSLTGVNMDLYFVTDWLGLVPLIVCLVFGVVGCYQLVSRKSLLKVDCDILILGVYCLIVVFCYCIFEVYPINFRPILIDGRVEASYPSSTTLLVLSIMPTLVFQIKRITNVAIRHFSIFVTNVFSAFMVIARLLSGVHWLTDIIGSVLLCIGLSYGYKTAVIFFDKDRG